MVASLLLTLDPSQSAHILERLGEKVREQTAKVNDEQKEYYNALAKYGKAIDKVASSDCVRINSDFLEIQTRSLERELRCSV